MHPGRDHLVVPLSGAGREVHLIGDQGHRFRCIETKPESARAPSQLRDQEDAQPVFFGWVQEGHHPSCPGRLGRAHPLRCRKPTKFRLGSRSTRFALTRFAK
jgi:hypothetical protein